MRLSRRTILRGAGALPLLANGFAALAFAQTPAAPAAADIPPILFVHGNGDQIGRASCRERVLMPV